MRKCWLSGAGDRQRVGVVGLGAVPSRIDPHPCRELRRDVVDAFIETNETLRDAAPHPVRALDRPHPFRVARDGGEHLDETIVGVLESSTGQQVLGRVQHRDRVRRFVRVHPDNHYLIH